MCRDLSSRTRASSSSPSSQCWLPFSWLLELPGSALKERTSRSCPLWLCIRSRLWGWILVPGATVRQWECIECIEQLFRVKRRGGGEDQGRKENFRGNWSWDQGPDTLASLASFFPGRITRSSNLGVLGNPPSCSGWGAWTQGTAGGWALLLVWLPLYPVAFGFFK